MAVSRGHMTSSVIVSLINVLCPSGCFIWNYHVNTDLPALTVRQAFLFEETDRILSESEGERHKQDWNSSLATGLGNKAHSSPHRLPLEGREGKAAQQEAVNA